MRVRLLRSPPRPRRSVAALRTSSGVLASGLRQPSYDVGADMDPQHHYRRTLPGHHEQRRARSRCIRDRRCRYHRRPAAPCYGARSVWRASRPLAPPHANLIVPHLSSCEPEGKIRHAQAEQNHQGRKTYRSVCVPQCREPRVPWRLEGYLRPFEDRPRQDEGDRAHCMAPLAVGVLYEDPQQP